MWAVGYYVPPTKLQGERPQFSMVREMETCRPVHPAQVVPLRAVKCMPHLHRAVARKRQHSSQQQKRVAECKRQHAYLSPCESATLYLEEHHLHAQPRLRRPLGRTTANGCAGALPCVWRVEPSVLPIGVDLAHPYGSALNFAGDTIPLITWLHGCTAARPCSFGRQAAATCLCPNLAMRCPSSH